ncbi:MAG: thioredoxin domain-containing protein [Microthrixaceae bacterium]
MDRLLPALFLAVVVIAVAIFLQRKKSAGPTDAITEHRAPTQLERSEFDSPNKPWLVAVFTSTSCSTCEQVWATAAVLESAEVAVQQIEVTQFPRLHEKYAITAVPIVALVGKDGLVQASFLGPVSATHLWAAVAELRNPGSVPPGCTDH